MALTWEGTVDDHATLPLGAIATAATRAESTLQRLQQGASTLSVALGQSLSASSEKAAHATEGLEAALVKTGVTTKKSDESFERMLQRVGGAPAPGPSHRLDMVGPKTEEKEGGSLLNFSRFVPPEFAAVNFAVEKLTEGVKELTSAILEATEHREREVDAFRGQGLRRPEQVSEDVIRNTTNLGWSRTDVDPLLSLLSQLSLPRKRGETDDAFESRKTQSYKWLLSGALGLGQGSAAADRLLSQFSEVAGRLRENPRADALAGAPGLEAGFQEYEVHRGRDPASFRGYGLIQELLKMFASHSADRAPSSLGRSLSNIHDTFEDVLGKGMPGFTHALDDLNKSLKSVQGPFKAFIDTIDIFLAGLTSAVAHPLTKGTFERTVASEVIRHADPEKLDKVGVFLNVLAHPRDPGSWRSVINVGRGLTPAGDLPLPDHATGDITTREHIARVGEGGVSEVIAPLSQLSGLLHEAGMRGGSGLPAVHLEINVHAAAGQSAEEIARHVARIGPIELSSWLETAQITRQGAD